MLGNSATWSRNYRRAGYAEGTTDRGRVLYRDGRLADAATCLSQAVATDPADGEACHLLGAALLEQGHAQEARKAFGRAVAAGRPYPPARYFLALDHMRRGGLDEAARQLERLVEAAPSHWEGRLLLAWVELEEGRPARAKRLAETAPADPRALWLRWKATRDSGDRDALDALLAEPGTPRRLDEFVAATAGRYVPPVRMLSGQRIVFARGTGN
jgi:tetratricopeptide (TPR) repeat protein